MEPPDSFEKGIRLGCGFFFGCFVGFAIALTLLTLNGHILVASCLIGGLVCALAALRYGDRFWLGVARFTTWGPGRCGVTGGGGGRRD
jgi:hypothetical protein